MIRFREITRDVRLLRTFADQYVAAGGFPLDLPYVQRCHAYALFRRGSMIGGFLINPAAPFRSLNDMPEEDRQRILARLDLDDTFEGTCLWVIPELRGTVLMMAFWAVVLLVLGFFPKRRVMASTVSRSLRNLYLGASPEVLYEGKIITPDRTLEKCVMLFPPVSHVIGGYLRETTRRIWRGLAARLRSSRVPTLSSR